MMTPSETIKHYDKLKGDRSTFESYWQNVSRLILPSSDFYNEHTPGKNRNRRLFDTTALYANDRFAGILHTFLTSPSQKWFTLTVDKAGPLTHADQLWIDDTTTRMYDVFNSESGMFHSQCHEMYLEIGAFGNGVLYSDYRKGRIRFKSYSLADCVPIENEEGVVDGIYRICRTTAYAAMRFFGDNASSAIKKKVEKDPFGMVKFLHCVKPRANAAKKGPRTAKEKAYSSIYLDMDTKEKMLEGGYDVFPYQFPRFAKRSGETYGYGPGMAAYSDARMLNRMMEVTIRGAEKIVDPPLLVPDDSVVGQIVINPGGVINYRPTSDPITPLVTNGRPDITFEILKNTRAQVMKHFYADWLDTMGEGNNEYMKATVATELKDRSFRQLGPMLSRFKPEFTGPLIDRVFDLMVTNDMLLPPPETLAGAPLKVNYTSPIEQMQRMTDFDGIARSLQLALQVAGAAPEVMQNFDMDEIVRYNASDINYIPAKLLRSQEQVADMRSQQIIERQAMMESEQAQQNTGAMKNAAMAAKAVAQVNV